MSNNAMEETLRELIVYQQKIVLRCGQRLIPQLTSDDVLQPNDFPELELDPLFRYEEGVLAGMLSAQMALRAQCNQSSGAQSSGA